MTNKSRCKKYIKTLTSRGLIRKSFIIPKKWAKHFEDEITKAREEHLKKIKGKDDEL